MKFLIAGLGNIGDEYTNTRHNIGFKIADALVSKHKASFSSDRHAFVSQFKIKNKNLVVIKPTTFMNLSGNAVRYWMQKEKIPIENVLIIVDELALPFGTIRMKGSGSDGGHNGLKSVQEILATQNYARMRFGIAAEFSKGKQVDYVLGEWNKEELKTLELRIEKCTQAVEAFCLAGLSNAMNEFNKA